jgi:hypothetical protein
LHTVSEMIERFKAFEVACPRCGFTYDIVKLFDTVTESGDVDALMEDFRALPGNQPPDGGASYEDMTPLARMMVANADAIDKTIESHGPEMVANWFMNTGAMVAAQYNLTATGDDETPFAHEEGNQ